MKIKPITCTRCCSHTRDAGSGVVASTQSPKIFVTSNLVAMTNSFQADGTLNGYRMALPISITGHTGFLVTGIWRLHGHQMVPSTPAVRHAWRPPSDGYGIRSDSNAPSKGPAPLVTTALVFQPPRRDPKPSLILEALKTEEGTTRSMAYLWWPIDGVVAHAAHGANIPNLDGDYRPLGGGNIVLSVHQLHQMWRFINTTALGVITADNLAASMGKKNAAVDVFALGFVVTLPFPVGDDDDSSVSFLVCIAEFIHVRHTDKGDLKNVVTSFIGAQCCYELHRLHRRPH